MRLIDADALIEFCAERWIPLNIDAVNMQPTIEPERKQGKWKPIGWSGRIHKCNQCGNMLDFGGVNAGRGDANFCPNCGADMRGKE